MSDEGEVQLDGGSHSGVVRVGDTVRRLFRPWAASTHELLRHLEREGFDGAPRVLGLDDQGREILPYVEGVVANGGELIAAEGGRFDRRFPDFVWSDDALVCLGRLVRGFHDAAATFDWVGRQWPFEPKEPVETMCHNELFPSNTVFRNGLPVAFIDFDTAAPGPRIRDLGCVAARWVPFWRDEKCAAAGLPTGVADKARRFRLLLDAYGVEPDVAIVGAAIDRTREMLDYQLMLVGEGSAWEVELERRGVLDETALEIAWMQEHAAALAGS